MDALTASVWFLPRGPHFLPPPRDTLIVLEHNESGREPIATTRLIEVINHCVHDDAIRVLRRHGDQPDQTLRSARRA
jgi:hypothetical protein